MRSMGLWRNSRHVPGTLSPCHLCPHGCLGSEGTAGGLSGEQRSLPVSISSAHSPRHHPAASLPASMPPRPAASSVPELRSLEKVSWASASSPTAPSPARPRPPARPVRAHVRGWCRGGPCPPWPQSRGGRRGMVPVTGTASATGWCFAGGVRDVGSMERRMTVAGWGYTRGGAGSAWPCSPTSQGIPGELLARAAGRWGLGTLGRRLLPLTLRPPRCQDPPCSELPA